MKTAGIGTVEGKGKVLGKSRVGETRMDGREFDEGMVGLATSRMTGWI